MTAVKEAGVPIPPLYSLCEDDRSEFPHCMSGRGVVMGGVLGGDS